MRWLRLHPDVIEDAVDIGTVLDECNDAHLATTDSGLGGFKTLAQSRGLSMNKLVEQLSALAATGDVKKALSVLDRLDAADAANTQAARRPTPAPPSTSQTPPKTARPA